MVPGRGGIGEADLGEASGKALLTADGQHLSIGRSHSFKGRRVALFVAWLRPDSVLDVLAQREGVRRRSSSSTRPAARTLPARRRRGASGRLRLALLPDRRMVEVSSREPGRKDGADYLAVRMAIPGQDPLLQVDRAEMLGELSPIASALHLAIAAGAVLVVLTLAIVLNTRALVLQARLDESLRREQEVAEKHDALQREMSERRRLEAAHAVLTMAIDHAAEAIAVTDEHGKANTRTPRSSAWRGARRRRRADGRWRTPSHPTLGRRKRSASRGAHRVRRRGRVSCRASGPTVRRSTSSWSRRPFTTTRAGW